MFAVPGAVCYNELSESLDELYFHENSFGIIV